MARLLIEDDLLGPNMSWYVADAYWDSERRGYRCEWPNATFVKCLAINHDEIQEDRSLRSNVLKYVERMMTDSVYTHTQHHQYWVGWGKKYESNGYTVANNWQLFWFQSEQDAALFALEFKDKISPLRKRKPEHDHLGPDGYEINAND